MKEYDIAIISSGPADLAAAVTAGDHGVESILILERDGELGGILNQCIHNGLGLHTFKGELTGPGYAARYEEQVSDKGTEHRLNIMVTDISRDEVVTAVNREEEPFEIQAKAVILAMGCRERSRGTLNTPGYRPTGISSVNTAQHLVSMGGFMFGRGVVILGFGDIGLIMVRHMTLEGAKVKVVAELIPYFGSLERNIVQRLNNYDVLLKLSHTMIDIRGKERPTEITLATVDERGKSIPGTEEDYNCDTLLLSVGSILKNELPGFMRVKMNRVTSGPVVNESLETSVEGIFVCGNMLHIHNLVGFVSEEAATAGRNVARYMIERGTDHQGHEINLKAVDGVCYTVPYTVNSQRMENAQAVRFRVGNVYKNCYIGVYFDDEQVAYRKRPAVTPGEMEEVKLEKEKLLLYPGLKTITIKVGEA